MGDSSAKPQDVEAGRDSIASLQNDTSGSHGFRVLYVCGEESVEQVGMRVSRLSRSRLADGPDNGQAGRLQKKSNTQDSIASLQNDKIALLAETDVDVIVASAQAEKPGVMIVDSIQTLSTNDLSGMAGSVGQVRESALRLIRLAKSSGMAVFLVGHVTKEGSIAGPKVLEHMVDAVITLEGEKTGLWRILRAYKNRFGAVDEVGVFSMGEGGMEDVSNPSGAFLEESQAGRPGSAVIALMEGTRPVLVEVQALAVKSQLAIPRRVSQGIGVNKLQLLCAVLEKHCRIPLGTYDVFVNVAGGLRILEPAADLGVALAIASSAKNAALPKKSVLMGEVGLLGEIRQVPFLKKRISEAKRMGYGQAVSVEEFGYVMGVVKGMLGSKSRE
jgi:DNA repair protein RadA/Sms